jgi:uncharacterized membrane protein YbhN (UPF0104 family)
VTSLLVIGAFAPTPGGIGGFHEAYRLAATGFFDVPNDRAVGAAIVLHAVSLLPVVVCGLGFMVAEGLSLRTLERVTSPTVDATPHEASV